MSVNKPKAIYIGPEAIGTFLVNGRPSWDFIIVPTIADLWEGLNSGKIDTSVQILITLDYFFDAEGNDNSFEQLVATMSPHCLFLIVQYHDKLEGQIRERISSMAASLGNDTNSEYFFISPKKPNVTIDRAVEAYIEHSENREVANVLAGKTPTEVEPVAPVQEMAAATIVTDSFFDDTVESDYMGQVIAVTSSKGGSGKSTVAMTLATYMAHCSQNSVREGLEPKPLKIVMLDLNIRDGQIGFLTGTIKPSVLHMRSKGINDTTLAETVIHNEKLGVDLLLAPRRPRLSDDTPAEFYLELIQFLKRHYDYILLDTSVEYLDPLLEKVAYPLADLIIFVTDIVVNSVFSMTRWVQEVTKPKHQQGMGITPSKIGIVVNKSISNVNMSGEKIAKSALGVPIITVIPNNAKLIAHATNNQSMELVLKHQDIRLAIRRLARAIVGKRYKLSDTVFR